MYLRFKLQTPHDFGIKIIGVGNLTVGGSGKTPLVSALAKYYEKPAIILRGYGRDSSGMIVVKDANTVLCDVKTSGDEAMIYAKKVPNAVVIVSEDRKVAIDKAKEMECKVVFLDDAYSKHDIKKTDILIEVESANGHCLPSGPYRERLWEAKEVVLLKEGVDFHREVKLVNAREKMSLVTAIARPSRLDRFLPEVVDKHYFEDHHSFTKEELEEILKSDKSESLLMTFKDYVKCEDFNLPISLLDLDIRLSEKVESKIKSKLI